MGAVGLGQMVDGGPRRGRRRAHRGLGAVTRGRGTGGLPGRRHGGDHRHPAGADGRPGAP
ncbi:hypothetical protein SFR_3344 [Streptomyces sp. FR-008]|nr:hypothetical protein SFR_3344 [Streptomyces sp. FR-008]